jgi:hypothetical protein
MRLEPQGRVGEGAAECERRWDVNIDDGRTILLMALACGRESRGVLRRREERPLPHPTRRSRAVVSAAASKATRVEPTTTPDPGEYARSRGATVLIPQCLRKGLTVWKNTERLSGVARSSR